MKKLYLVPLAALAALAACSEAPTGPDGESPPHQLVITEGVKAPPRRPGGPLFSTLHTPTLSVGGSITTPVSVKGPTCADGPAEVTISYRVNGKQAADASFDVFTRWDYAGGEFSHSNDVQDVQHVVVKSRDNNSAGNDYYTVTISITNSDNTSGTASFEVKPENLQTSGGPSDILDAKNGAATVYVNLMGCEQEVENTPPSISIPADIVKEATSSAGAPVHFVVTASDEEDGDLTSKVDCKAGGIPVQSGDLFPFGETIVECSVKDSGGLSAEGSFKITVEDTTAPVFIDFPPNQTLIAANINGAVLDFESLDITAEDQGPNGEPGNISDPVTTTCDYAAGTWLEIGSITTVACTATDGRGNAATETFEVFVTPGLSPLSGFEPPLRMAAPFSAHKAGSTIPHKFAAPRYADGTLATDLASGLRLTLTKQSGGEEYQQETMDEYGAGSTAWRYSPSHYIFNLKTEKGWGAGEWTTTVSYAGIELATTTFSMRN